jgi:hypothetical protein
VNKGFQAIAAEVTNYSKKAFEDGTRAFERRLADITFYLAFSPSICSIRSLPAFSNSASVWPRSPLTISFVGLGSSSAHRPARRQQIDRSRFIRSILQLPGSHDGNMPFVVRA